MSEILPTRIQTLFIQIQISNGIAKTVTQQIRLAAIDCLENQENANTN